MHQWPGYELSGLRRPDDAPVINPRNHRHAHSGVGIMDKTSRRADRPHPPAPLGLILTVWRSGDRTEIACVKKFL